MKARSATEAATAGEVLADLAGDLFADATLAGIPLGVPLQHLTRAQLEELSGLLMRKPMVASARVLNVHPAAGRTQPRGAAGLRLVAEDGQLAVDARTLAALRRRKPIHIQEAS